MHRQPTGLVFRAGGFDPFVKLVLWLATLVGCSCAGAENLAARVVLVANSADADSVRVARHYAEVRNAPLENVIALPMPVSETISWTEFIESIWNPLRAELVRTKWIDATSMDLTDRGGRKKYAISSHRIAYVVVCRGVPLRIRHEPKLYKAAPPQTNNTIFRTNAAAVDSELSLLAQPNHEINGYQPNPLYGYERIVTGAASRVIKVSRLDGPTVEDALALPDHAIAAERTGLVGRAYVDIGGIHADGDRWLESVAQQLAALGFESDVDREPATISSTARFDAPVLYFGWYTATVNGPFAVPGFRFPPGAVAMHIHSFSAATLRDASTGWCGPLIARGVTATVGNVFEPYLQLTHRPDFLLRALARGENFGDAVYYAQPALGWNTIAIGDPLYRPFNRNAPK